MKNFLAASLLSLTFFSVAQAKELTSAQKDIVTVANELISADNSGYKLSLKDSECQAINNSSRHFHCAINFVDVDGREPYGFLVEVFFGEPEDKVVDKIIAQDANEMLSLADLPYLLD